MANGLKYKDKDLTAIQFDKPVRVLDFDFENDWILNPDNSEGITIDDNVITVTKVKPGTWFIRSNYQLADITATNTKFYNHYFKIFGIQRLRDDSVGGITRVEDYPTLEHESTNMYLPYGLVVTPFKVDESLLLSHYAPNEAMNIPNGAFGVGNNVWGWRSYGFANDGNYIFYDFNCRTSGWGGNFLPYSEVAFVFFTGVSGDPNDNGYLTLSYPFSIYCLDNTPADPTTVEGYKASLGSNVVYDKAKTFDNTLKRHCLATRQSGAYEKAIQSNYLSITDSPVDVIGGNFNSKARFTIKDAGGSDSILVDAFYFLENRKWRPNMTNIAINDTVTIIGKIKGCKNEADIHSTSMVGSSGRIFELNGVRSTLGNTVPNPPSTPMTVSEAITYAKTLGDGVSDTNDIYIAGKITGINYHFSPPYSDYNKLRFPVPIDLESLIVSGNTSGADRARPIKFHCTQYDTVGHTGFWSTVANIFNSHPITNATYATYLFANAGGSTIPTLNITFDINGYIDANGMFDHSNFAEAVNFTMTNGSIKALHDIFRQSKTIQSVTFSRDINVSQFSGAFEGASMTTFPTHVVPLNEMDETKSVSNGVCIIQYAADGSALTYFGNYKDASAADDSGNYNPTSHPTLNKYYVLNVDPSCVGAFARSSIEEIKYLLDMEQVNPILWNICNDDTERKFNAVFNVPSLETARIYGLNKGDWSLDGVDRNDANGDSCCAGNLSGLDADSTNYMLSNLFNLQQNNTSTGDTAHFESAFNSLRQWNKNGGLKYTTEYQAWDNAYLSKDLSSSSGTMKIVPTNLTNCTIQIEVAGAITQTIDTVRSSSNPYELALTGDGCKIKFVKTDANENMYGRFYLYDPFRSELTPGLTSANIYLPAELDTHITAVALGIANSRGWTVYVGGNQKTSV